MRHPFGKGIPTSLLFLQRVRCSQPVPILSPNADQETDSSTEAQPSTMTSPMPSHNTGETLPTEETGGRDTKRMLSKGG